MKSFFKRALRTLFILTAISAVLCTVISCEQPKSSSTAVYQNDSAVWKAIIQQHFSSLDGNVYKSTYGDWVKFFIVDGELKMFNPSKDINWQPVISAEAAKTLTYNELCENDKKGHRGTFVALGISDETPNNGKMLLLKSDNHINYGAGYCYENPAIGTEAHHDCYIPTYISISESSILWMEYYSTEIYNDEATGTACFAKYSTALNYLPYSKGSWTNAEYSKNASSNLQYWTLVE